MGEEVGLETKLKEGNNYAGMGNDLVGERYFSTQGISPYSREVSDQETIIRSQGGLQ